MSAFSSMAGRSPVHLNVAGAGVPSSAVVGAVRQYLDIEGTLGPCSWSLLAAPAISGQSGSERPFPIESKGAKPHLTQVAQLDSADTFTA
ncbi:hypothetical protein [Micromonospora sp. NPDC092111]|uniref:hypothetical protein n=1 Tax=Micromonospora sp. NPDC092111 TaxID=3364289 RepID=UPI003805F757